MISNKETRIGTYDIVRLCRDTVSDCWSSAGITKLWRRKKKLFNICFVLDSKKKKNYVTVCYFMVCCFKRKTLTCLNRWRFPGSFSSSKNSFSSNDSTKANARQSASNNENFMLPWELHEFTEDCEIVKASFIQNQKKAELSCKVKQTKYAAALNKTKV